MSVRCGLWLHCSPTPNSMTFPPAAGGPASLCFNLSDCDCFDQQSMADVILCDFQDWVKRGHTASAWLFWDIHSSTPPLPVHHMLAKRPAPWRGHRRGLTAQPSPALGFPRMEGKQLPWKSSVPDDSDYQPLESSQ
jgi:hypothetical protein